MSYLETLLKERKARLGRLAKAGLEQQKKEQLRNETAHQRLAREIAALIPERVKWEKPRRLQKSVASIVAIQRATAAIYEITRDDLISRSREESFMVARMVSMYIAKELTGLSHSLIAKQTGNRDHCASTRAQKLIFGELARGNAQLAEKIGQIKARLVEGA